MIYKYAIPKNTTSREVSDIYRWEQDNDAQLAIAERLEGVVATLEMLNSTLKRVAESRQEFTSETNQYRPQL